MNDVIRPLLGAASVIVLALTLGACAISADSGSTALPMPTLPPVAQTGPCCGPITPAGERLRKAIDSMHVEDLWPEHREVQWDTGEPIGPVMQQVHDPETHCSLFTAAVGKQVDVYLPRPPMYRQTHLSESQLAYFRSHAGWHKLDTPEQAQALANRGWLVIVGYDSANIKYARRNGHIAVVRPSDMRTEAQIDESGVAIAQAGGDNRSSTSAKFGFKHHPGAFPDKLEYYAHAIPEAVNPRP
jgi:hypothetical protein